MKTDLAALMKSSIYAEEALLVDTQSLLEAAMQAKGVSRAGLANAMGVSRARVTQMFSDDGKNFTLRLLARALHALGERLDLRLESERSELPVFSFALDLSSDEAYPAATWHRTYVANDDRPAAACNELEVSQTDRSERVEELMANALRYAQHKREAA